MNQLPDHRKMHAIGNTQFPGPNSAGRELVTTPTLTTLSLAVSTPVSWAVLSLVWDVHFLNKYWVNTMHSGLWDEFLSDLRHIGAGSLEAWRWLPLAPSKHSSLSEPGIWGRGRSREEGPVSLFLVSKDRLSLVKEHVQSPGSRGPPGSCDHDDFTSGDSLALASVAMAMLYIVSVKSWWIFPGWEEEKIIIEWNYK